MEPSIIFIIILIIVFIILFAFCNSSSSLFGGYRTTELHRKNATGRDLYSVIDMKHDVPVCADENIVLPSVETLNFPYREILKTFGMFNARYIGSGAMGAVFLCKVSREYIKPGKKQVMCVKISTREEERIKSDMITDAFIDKLERTSNDYDNVVERVANDYRLCAVYGSRSFRVRDATRYKTYYAILMQNLCGKSLSDINIRTLSLNILKIIIFNLICGVYALHEVFHIMHLDLKPDNIMYTEQVDPSNPVTYANLRIIDWGCAIPLNGVKQIATRSRCGTPLYIPPDQILTLFTHNRSTQTFILGYKDDIFALGTIIYNLLTGTEGFYSSGNISTEQIVSESYRIVRDPIQKRSEIFTNVMRIHNDEALARLVTRALELDESRRATIKDLINDPVFDTIPLKCVPNFLYEREEYIRRIDMNTDVTNSFIMANREIDMHVTDTNIPKIQLPPLPKTYEDIKTPLPKTQLGPMSKSYIGVPREISHVEVHNSNPPKIHLAPMSKTYIQNDHRQTNAIPTHLAKTITT